MVFTQPGAHDNYKHTHPCSSHGPYETRTLLPILQGLPASVAQATAHICTRNGYLRQGAWLQGEIRALLTNLSIWLSLHLLKGTFGTWHAAAFPASFLVPCSVSALMPRLLAVVRAHPASWSPICSFFKVRFSSLFSVSLNST